MALFLLNKPIEVSEPLNGAEPINTSRDSSTNEQRVADAEPSNTIPNGNTPQNSNLQGEYLNVPHEGPSELSNVSFDSFLVREDNSRTLVTSVFEEQTTDNLRTLATNLGFDDDKSNLAYETEYKLERKLGEFPDMQTDTTRCSSSMCASLFTGRNGESVLQTLDSLSRDVEIGSISGGGYMRHIVENGIHYGIIVVVFKDEVPLTIR